MNTKNIKVLYISIHPAPYRDSTLFEIFQSKNIDIKVFEMFEKDFGHLYWKFKKQNYPSVTLGKSFSLGGSYFHINILKYLIAEKFDVLIIPGYYHITSIISLFYCNIKRKPFIFSADTVSSVSAENIKNNPIRKLLMNWVIKKSAAFWIPGNASRRYFTDKGVDTVKIFEGSYCLDPNQIKYSFEKAYISRKELRKSIGVDSKGFVYLMVGNMISNRHQIDLVKAFKAVENINSNAYLLLLGEGSERESILKTIASENCLNVKLINPVAYEKLAHWYAASDAYIHSGYEPYSTAVEYAAKSGLPIVTTHSVGASFDYVKDAESGYVVKYGDWEGLSKKMLELSLNPELALLYGRNAYNNAIKRNTTWAGEQFEAAVKRAIKGRK